MRYIPTLKRTQEIDEELSNQKKGKPPPITPTLRLSPAPYSFLNDLKAVGEGLISLPATLSHDIMGSLNELKTNPSGFLPDVGRGLRGFGQNDVGPALLGLAKEATKVPPFSFAPKDDKQSVQNLAIPHYQGDQNPVSQLTELITSLYPIGKAASIGEKLTGGLRNLLPGAVRAAPKTIKGVTKLAGLAAGGALGAPIGGIPMRQGAILGVATPVLESPLSLIAKRFGAASAQKLGGLAASQIAGEGGLGSKGALTHMEYRERLNDLPSGIKMPIGDIVGSPSLKGLYQALGTITGSGATAPYERLRNYLVQAADEVKGVAHYGKGDINEYLYGENEKKYNAALKRTTAAYAKVAKLEDEKKTPFNPSHFRKRINEILEEIKPKLLPKVSEKERDPIITTPFLGDYSKIPKGDLIPSPVNKELKISDALYGPINNVLKQHLHKPLPDFEAAIGTDQGLNKRIGSLSKIPENREKLFYLQRMKQALNKSFHDSESNIQSQKLMEAYREAKKRRVEQSAFEKFGKKENTPFFNLFLKQTPKVGHFLSSYLHPEKGTNTNKVLLNKLLSHIPDEARKAAKGSYLEHPQMDMPNLSLFSKKLERLGPVQRKMLLQNQAPLAEQILRLTKRYPDSKNPAFIPKTGLTGAKAIPIWTLLAALGSGAVTGHFDPSLAIGSALGGAYGAQAALRSDAIKKLYGRGLGNPRKGPKPLKSIKRKLPRHSLATSLRAAASQKIRKEDYGS